MRILLIAYEYPPIVSAQSLRWYYLGNELARLGHHIDVVCARLEDIWRSDLALAQNINVYPVFAGPLLGGMSALYRVSRAGKKVQADPAATGQASGLPAGLYRRLRALWDKWYFPDARTEWYPFALRKLKQLISSNRYDVVISSHEPGVDLLLGLKLVEQHDLPWIADLGDVLGVNPVSKTRVNRELFLEARVCESARGVLVTNNSARELLTQRHALSEARCEVITQGFAITGNARDKKPAGNDKVLTLVYTGSLYANIRNPHNLLTALEGISRVRLIIAGYADAPVKSGRHVTHHAYVSHARALALQRRAGALLHIGNLNPWQVPGKFYEYLGACRPILHVAMHDGSDPCADLVRSLDRGMVVENEPTAIRAALTELRDLWDSSSLERRFDLSLDPVVQYSWPAQAARLEATLKRFLEQRFVPA